MVFMKKEKNLWIKNKVGRLLEVPESRAKYMIVYDLAELMNAPVKKREIL